MRIKAHAVSVLLAALLAISGIMIQFPGGGVRHPKTVPAQVLSAMRNCLAAIDQFIGDGNLDALWQTLDQFGHGLDPWPQTNLARRSLTALAFRATFPHIHFSLGEITPSDGLYTARIGVADGVLTAPVWLESREDPVPPVVDALLGIDERGALTGSSALLSEHPLVFAPPNPGAPFALYGPSHLVATHLTLTHSQHGSRSLAVTGPALIVPEAGMLRVAGDGSIFAPGEPSTDWRRLAVGETMTIAPGDLLYLPNGTAILTLASSESARLLYAAVLPDTLPDDAEPEGGRVIHSSLAGTIMAASAPSPVWFGSIDWVRQTERELGAGNGSLSAAWVVLPTGVNSAFSPGDGVLLALDFPMLETIPDQAADDIPTSDSAEEIRIVLVLRASSS